MEQLFQAIQEGDLQQINGLLESFLMDAEPSAQYEVAEALTHYGYMNEANRVFEHLQFLFPEEAQIAIDRAGVLIELGEEDDGVSADADKDVAQVARAKHVSIGGVWRRDGLCD